MILKKLKRKVAFYVAIIGVSIGSGMPSIQAENYADFKDYEKDFVELVEMIYGKGFLSQGGELTVRKMFSGMNLAGMKVLDIGSGLGAPSLYLAREFSADIIGIDPQEVLIEEASKRIKPLQGALKGSLKFMHMQDPTKLSLFEDRAFDVIFSRESLLHVPPDIKETLFQDMYRVLKPSGRLIIMDWLHTSSQYSEDTKRMMELDHLVFHLMTPSDYQQFLEKQGFASISYEDVTDLYVKITQDNIETIESMKDAIVERFGEDMYRYSLESWALQKQAFERRDFIPGILIATRK